MIKCKPHKKTIRYSWTLSKLKNPKGMLYSGITLWPSPVLVSWLLVVDASTS